MPVIAAWNVKMVSGVACFCASGLSRMLSCSAWLFWGGVGVSCWLDVVGLLGVDVLQSSV